MPAKIYWSAKKRTQRANAVRSVRVLRMQSWVTASVNPTLHRRREERVWVEKAGIEDGSHDRSYACTDRGEDEGQDNLDDHG